VTPTGVIFDLDGVLADLDVAAAAAFFGRLLPISLRALGGHWERWLAAQNGDLRDPSLWRRYWNDLADSYDLGPDARATLFAFDYRTLYRPQPDARAALLAARRAGLRTAVLSNTPLADLRELLQALALADLIDAELFPQSTGTAKPAPAAYNGALAALGVAAPDCLFFDDEPANVAGARALGLRAFHVDRGRNEPDELERGVVGGLACVSALVGRAE
jgi:putative hydrolase of the HAD superfamily